MDRHEDRDVVSHRDDLVTRLRSVLYPRIVKGEEHSTIVVLLNRGGPYTKEEQKILGVNLNVQDGVQEQPIIVYEHDEMSVQLLEERKGHYYRTDDGPTRLKDKTAPTVMVSAFISLQGAPMVIANGDSFMSLQWLSDGRRANVASAAAASSELPMEHHDAVGLRSLSRLREFIQCGNKLILKRGIDINTEAVSALVGGDVAGVEDHDRWPREESIASEDDSFAREHPLPSVAQGEYIKVQRLLASFLQERDASDVSTQLTHLTSIGQFSSYDHSWCGVFDYQLHDCKAKARGWQSQDMEAQAERVLLKHKLLFPGVEALFLFDNSSNHGKMPENALLPTKIYRSWSCYEGREEVYQPRWMVSPRRTTSVAENDELWC